MSYVDETRSRRFLLRLRRCQAKLKQLLHDETQRQHPNELSHDYSNKYTLVEQSVRSFTLELGQLFDRLGCIVVSRRNSSKDEEYHHHWIQLKRWIQEEKKTITCRFQMNERCTYDREIERDVVSERSVVVKKKTFLGLVRRKRERGDIRTHAYLSPHVCALLSLYSNVESVQYLAPLSTPSLTRSLT